MGYMGMESRIGIYVGSDSEMDVHFLLFKMNYTVLDCMDTAASAL